MCARDLPDCNPPSYMGWQCCFEANNLIGAINQALLQAKFYVDQVTEIAPGMN